MKQNILALPPRERTFPFRRYYTKEEAKEGYATYQKAWKRRKYHDNMEYRMADIERSKKYYHEHREEILRKTAERNRQKKLRKKAEQTNDI